MLNKLWCSNQFSIRPTVSSPQGMTLSSESCWVLGSLRSSISELQPVRRLKLLLSFLTGHISTRVLTKLQIFFMGFVSQKFAWQSNQTLWLQFIGDFKLLFRRVVTVFFHHCVHTISLIEFMIFFYLNHNRNVRDFWSHYFRRSAGSLSSKCHRCSYQSEFVISPLGKQWFVKPHFGENSIFKSSLSVREGYRSPNCRNSFGKVSLLSFFSNEPGWIRTIVCIVFFFRYFIEMSKVYDNPKIISILSVISPCHHQLRFKHHILLNTTQLPPSREEMMILLLW